MRVLKAAVIVMGVLIVAGVATIIVTIVQRTTGGVSVPGSVMQQELVDEPDGTHIAGVSMGTDKVAVQLQGGGPDRLLVLDARTGRVVLRAALAK